MKTGWLAEAPDEGPAMPMTELALRGKDQRQSPLAVSAARSAAEDARDRRARADAAVDPDERAAGLVRGGYKPGAMFDLGQRLADAQAELEHEREKLAAGAR